MIDIFHDAGHTIHHDIYENKNQSVCKLSYWDVFQSHTDTEG